MTLGELYDALDRIRRLEKSIDASESVAQHYDRTGNTVKALEMRAAIEVVRRDYEELRATGLVTRGK